jgi:hypothetical protein
MTDDPIEFDEHRGMAAQRGTEIRAVFTRFRPTRRKAFIENIEEPRCGWRGLAPMRSSAWEATDRLRSLAGEGVVVGEYDGLPGGFVPRLGMRLHIGKEQRQ